MLSLSFIKEIEKIIGRENVLTGEADRQNYAYDAAVLPPVVPGLVVRPTRTDQLGPLIQKCYEEGIPITIRGSGTNLSGGTIPDSTDAVIILTNSLDRILEINEEEMYAVVEPGVITCDLAAAVAARGLFYPPDPGSMSVSTMGGNIAENSGGLRGLKYGTTKKYVMGLEVAGTYQQGGPQTGDAAQGFQSHDGHFPRSETRLAGRRRDHRRACCPLYAGIHGQRDHQLC